MLVVMALPQVFGGCASQEAVFEEVRPAVCSALHGWVGPPPSHGLLGLP